MRIAKSIIFLQYTITTKTNIDVYLLVFFFFFGVCGENSLNLNPQFKLLFFLSITTNNNLPLKIYYKNVMDITFLFNNTNFTTFLQMIAVVMAQSNIF